MLVASCNNNIICQAINDRYTSVVPQGAYKSLKAARHGYCKFLPHLDNLEVKEHDGYASAILTYCLGPCK